MNESGKKKSDGLFIAGGIALIAVLCPFCGETLHDSFRWGQFCPWCGEKIER